MTEPSKGSSSNAEHYRILGGVRIGQASLDRQKTSSSPRLEPIYRQIPTFRCIQGCGDCCGLVPWSAEEWARVADRAPEGVDLLDFEGCVIPAFAESTRCPFFDHGCTVYEDRPFMCRLFGTAADARLACPHGKRPTQQLTAVKARRLKGRYLREIVSDA